MGINYRAKAVKSFVEAWEGRGDEKQDTQSFWIDLFHSVLGVENPTILLHV